MHELLLLPIVYAGVLVIPSDVIVTSNSMVCPCSEIWVALLKTWRN